MLEYKVWRTDGRTNGRTDIVTYRVACTRLKMSWPSFLQLFWCQLQTNWATKLGLALNEDIFQFSNIKLVFRCLLVGVSVCLSVSSPSLTYSHSLENSVIFAHLSLVEANTWWMVEVGGSFSPSICLSIHPSTNVIFKHCQFQISASSVICLFFQQNCNAVSRKNTTIPYR